jgi:cytochrome d ubiquinol oxidase subunit II
MDLPQIWFGLLGVLLTGYAILDGFDLGVGILHPLAKTGSEKRLFLNSIGPLWDGNEVWLVTFGGAMFAMFPEAYATVFSAFYIPFMVLLCALILRAVSLEFRSKVESPAWRRTWDRAFFVASTVATLIFGVGVGNFIVGIPLNARGVFTGGVLDLLGPYPLLVGLLAVSLFALHGSIYLHLKTEGDVQARLGPWMWHSWGIFLVLYFSTTIYTLIAAPGIGETVRAHPWLAAVPLLDILAIANIPRALFRERYGQAFLSSALNIACMVGLLGAALYPNLVPARNDPASSLSIHDAASSTETLTIGLTIVIVGMPFVLGYTAAIYWAFRGKVRLDENAY